MIRRGHYCKYIGKVYRCNIDNLSVLLRTNDIEDFEQQGFERNPYYDEKAVRNPEKYLKEVPKEEIEWFCEIGNSGYYKGYKVGIISETDTEYLICSGFVSADNKVFTKENGFEEIDRYLFEGKVPKSEVTDVKEVKTPINKYLKAPDNWDF